MINRENFIGKVISGGGFVFDFAKWLVILAVLLSLVHYFLITIYIVDGASMDPTFKSGEVGVLSKITYELGNPKRGDVVVVKYPGDPEHKRYVKRVIGMPGEVITVQIGGVFINNKSLAESYLGQTVATVKDGTWKLGKDEYFLMGDNRLNSNDSRYFGPVEKRFIIGKTVWILLPRFFSVITPTYTMHEKY
jgi:signal peptidase I